MYNNYILSLVGSVLPILAISFVSALLCYKIYIKIRSNFNTNVNCWFCNQNARVPYLQGNSWTCPNCEQYNGFTKDGDYNRDIFQQRDCSNLSGTSAAVAAASYLSPSNGFCDSCNEAQRLKVEKLAQFEPKNESHFDKELKVLKAQLEETHRLCSTCDRHLNKVLREKKKMVLGSKFLDFIIKGAETLKQPHFNQIRCARQQRWKRRCSMWIIIFTVFNIICLFNALPPLNREVLIKTFGEMLGTQIFFLCSHIFALSKVFYTYVEDISSHPTAIKSALFMRTVFMMLLYSMGLKWPQVISLHFSSLYILTCPFVLLSFAFLYNVVDGFKLTRYTFLMVVWSVFAGGLVDNKLILSKDLVLLLASFATIVLSATCKNAVPSTKLADHSGNSSFHKIYSEDYFSDDESMNSVGGSTSSTTQQSTHYYRRLSSSPRCRPSVTAGEAAVCNPRMVYSSLSSPLHHSKTHPGMSYMPPENDNFKSTHVNGYNSSMGSPYAASLFNLSSHQNAVLPRTTTVFRPNSELRSRSNFESRPVYDSPVNVNASNLHKSTFLNPNSLLFSTTARNTTNNFITNNATLHSPPPSSPFLVAGSPVYQHHPSGNNVLTPSRFNATCSLPNNTSSSISSSWLSGGYFNQRNATLVNQSDNKQNKYLLGPQNGMTSGVEENFSRASSQSSGFESQNSRPTNLSRDNSISPEACDPLERTTTTADHVKGFQPIERNGFHASSSSCSPRPISLLSVTPQPSWLGTHTVRETLGNAMDSFNLRKIDEDLPTIKRADLHLRKWKEGQALA